MHDKNFTPADAPFHLPGAHSHYLRARATDDLYRIDIAVPTTAAPPGGWPAVFLLDASGCFATCVEALRRMSRRPDATGVENMVVVGISQPEHAYDTVRRRRDFGSPRAGDGPAGNAPAFLRFLATEVKPLAARHAALDPRRQTLFGHSLAGYFTLWVLANHPDSFRAYAAISPSIWWDRDGLLHALSNVTARDRRALICIGGWEDTLPPWQLAAPGSAEVMARRQQRQMIANAETAATHLTAALGADRVKYHLLPDEDHASILSAAIPRTLRMASLAGRS